MTQGFINPIPLPLPVNKGGTEAQTSTDARTNLGVGYATQADMETATSTSTVVAPGTQKFHPGNIKAWVRFNGTNTSSLDGYNVSSLTDDAVGKWTVNFTTSFSTNGYCIVLNAQSASGGPEIDWRSAGSVNTSSFGFWTWASVANTFVDPTICSAIFLGDFA